MMEEFPEGTVGAAFQYMLNDWSMRDSDPIAKRLNDKVVKEFDGTEARMGWPGRQHNVVMWVITDTGYGVGFNENVSIGWSFPVIRLKPEQIAQYTETHHDHDEFKASLGIKVEGAPQDVSEPVLQELLNMGYTETTWQTSASAVDSDCLVLDGDLEPLADLLSGLMYNAPIYEKTHVGCTCTVLVEGEGMEPVIVGAFGAQ